jgi:Myb-like DNA-binding domain
MSHLCRTLFFQTRLNPRFQAPLDTNSQHNLPQQLITPPKAKTIIPTPNLSNPPSVGLPSSWQPSDTLKSARLISAGSDSTLDATDVVSFEAGDQASEACVQDQLESARINCSKRKSPVKKSAWGEADDIELDGLVKRWKCDWKKICRRFKNKGKPSSRHFLKNRIRVIRNDPYLLKQKFSHEEDLLIATLVDKYDIDWISIARFIPNRTPVMIKNRYYSHIHRKGLMQSLLDEAASLDPENNVQPKYDQATPISNFNPSYQVNQADFAQLGGNYSQNSNFSYTNSFGTGVGNSIGSMSFPPQLNCHSGNLVFPKQALQYGNFGNWESSWNGGIPKIKKATDYNPYDLILNIGAQGLSYNPNRRGENSSGLE